MEQTGGCVIEGCGGGVLDGQRLLLDSLSVHLVVLWLDVISPPFCAIATIDPEISEAAEPLKDEPLGADVMLPDDDLTDTLAPDDIDVI